MRSVKLLILLISALTLSISGCKKEKTPPPSGGGGGGSSSYLVPSSGDNSITTCSGVIRDHAGNEDYENNIDGYTVINPTSSDDNIELSFTSFALEDCCDYVTVFDGVGTSGTVLFEGNGTTLPPTITASNGPLTIRHTSDLTVTNSGFAATISCVSGDGFNCVSGNCQSVGSDAQFATLSDCQALCSGGTSGYNCVSGNCQSVSSGAQYGTLSECQSACGGSSDDCCDCTGIGFVCDECCDGEFDMLGESWATWLSIFEGAGCNCD